MNEEDEDTKRHDRHDDLEWRRLQDREDNFVAPRGHASRFARLQRDEAQSRTDRKSWLPRSNVPVDAAEIESMRRDIEDIRCGLAKLKAQVASGSGETNAKRIDTLEQRIEAVNTRLSLLWGQVPATEWVRSQLAAAALRSADIGSANKSIAAKLYALDQEVRRMNGRGADNFTEWAKSYFFSKHDAQAFIDGCFPNAPLMKEIDRHIDARIAAAIGK